MADGPENLDSLMMGEASEEVTESDEQIQARIAAAQAKLKKIQKDEKKAHNFDEKLAKVIPSLHARLIIFIGFLIDKNVPSLTILAMITLSSDKAGKICHDEFHKYIKERADFAPAKLNEKQEEKVSLWWTFIFAADHVSTTLKLKELKGDKDFVTQVNTALKNILHDFLIAEGVESHDEKALERVLAKYATMMFENH